MFLAVRLALEPGGDFTGHGAPFPFRAVSLLLAAAARGIGIEGASWGKPEPRFEPLTQGSEGALIEREDGRPQVANEGTKRFARSIRTMGQLPITWDCHLRQLPVISSWLRQGARRHWQRAASNDAQGEGGWRRQALLTPQEISATEGAGEGGRSLEGSSYKLLPGHMRAPASASNWESLESPGRREGRQVGNGLEPQPDGCARLQG